MSDLIRRSDAIKALCDAVDNKGNYEGEWLYTDEFCKAIDSVPSADRPQGEWIMHFDDIWPEESSMECSVCHEEQPLGIDDNFCPNCGARMKGADDEV